MTNMNRNRKRGVTLVEIAIVLVIIGLLLGGVLKGQELINNAKVRSIADRQNSLKVAWFAFLDRYQALPGDYVYAADNIIGAIDGGGDGTIIENESPIALQHMTGAGYLRCPQCTADAAGAPTARNSLQNQYGGIMSIWHDGVNYAAIGGPNGSLRLYVHTGPFIPSNVIAEVDRKIDDGIANTGDFVFNQWHAGQVAPVVTQCTATGNGTNAANGADSGALNSSNPNAWRSTQAKPPIVQNCGGSVAI